MIKILSAGYCSSIQDAGRFGFRHLGVPVSGCMDLTSYNLANALLNNSPTCSVIESTYIGPRIQFLASTYVAVTGAQCQLLLNSHCVSINTVLSIKKGDILEVGKTRLGCRNYLSILDGFNHEKTLNSQSQYKGITRYNQLQNNHVIPTNQSNRVIRNRASVQLNKQLFNSYLIPTLKGPEFSLLSKQTKTKLFSQSFSLSSQSNRMAFLFNQDLPAGTDEIITSSVQPGTVQLTPSGKVIVLMRDAQTTGGYARILQLTNLAISQLSQLPVNSKFRFMPIKKP